MLADAAEGQGDMRRAHEYDEKAKKGWRKYGKTIHVLELAAPHRRDALKLLQAGRAHEAGCTLKYVPDVYLKYLKRGINFTGGKSRNSAGCTQGSDGSVDAIEHSAKCVQR